jgi:uncharacterized protein DUF5989
MIFSSLREFGLFCMCAKRLAAAGLPNDALFDGLVVLTKGSAVASFIYTLF